MTRSPNCPASARSGRWSSFRRSVVPSFRRSVVPSSLVSPADGSPLFDPNSFAGDDDAIGTHITEGRFADPSVPNEFTVNRPLAAVLSERFGTDAGDSFTVVSFSQQQVDEQYASFESPSVPAFRATLVGITESPTEFDDPSPQVVFSRSFLTAHPDVGVVRTMISLRLDDGVDPALVMGAVRRMPAAADAYASRTRAVSDSARRAVRFQVTALWLVSALALLAAGTVIVVIATRSLRLSDDERRSMTTLGWRRSDLALDRGMEGGALAAVAVLVAAVVAAIVSSRFPLGVLRTFEPDPGLRVDWIATVIGGASLVITVVVTGLAVITVVVTVVVTSLAVGYGRRRPAAFRSPPTRSSSLVPSASAGMPLSVGARFASSGPRGRRSWSQLVAGSLGVAGLLASVIVGLSLTRIVERPMR